MTARLNTDGLTIVRLKATASTHRININNGAGGSDNGGNFSATDDNNRTTMIAVSNSDGTSIIGLYADSSGKLLINSH